MQVQKSESSDKAQFKFVFFCGAGLCLSLLAWLVNFDVSCRYFFGAGFIPMRNMLPGYRVFSVLAVDLSTITPALFVALFGLPLYASRSRAIPFPRNFFARCTYAGLAGTLIGVMIAFWNDGGSDTPIEQAKQLFSRLTVGLPTAIISTLAGIVVPTAAFYMTRWYCIAFHVSPRQSMPLSAWSRAVQLATAEFTPLVDAMGKFQRGCVEGATMTERFVAQISALGKALAVVTSSMSDIGSRGAKVIAWLGALQQQMARSTEILVKFVAAITNLAGEAQLVRKQLNSMTATNETLRAEYLIQVAALVKRSDERLEKILDALPDAIARAVSSSLKPLETAVTTSQHQLRRRIALALSDDFSDLPDSTPVAKDPTDVSRNGHSFSRQ